MHFKGPKFSHMHILWKVDSNTVLEVIKMYNAFEVYIIGETKIKGLQWKEKLSYKLSDFDDLDNPLEIEEDVRANSQSKELSIKDNF